MKERREEFFVFFCFGFFLVGEVLLQVRMKTHLHLRDKLPWLKALQENLPCGAEHVAVVAFETVERFRDDRSTQVL